MSIPVCKFYSCNRNCKFGKHCRFLHSNSSQPSNISRDSFDQSNHGDLDKEVPPISNTQQPSKLFAQTTGHHEDSSIKSRILGPNFSASVEITQDEAKSDTLTLNDDGKKTRSRPICSHFIHHGWCKFGRSCRFSHPKRNQPDRFTNLTPRVIPPRFQKKEVVVETAISADEENDSVDSLTQQTQTQNENVVDDTNRTVTKQEEKNSKPRPRLCKYFKSGYCYKGSRCPFSHQSSRNDNPVEQVQVKSTQSSRPRRIIKPPGQPQILSLTEVDEDGTDKYRQLDISFLQKRFQGCVNGDGNPTADDDFVAEVDFSPSDPDWPFDMNSFVLEMIMVADYPKQPMQVKVPIDKQDLPETVRRSLELSIADWINSRHSDTKAAGKVELVARPFFKWLDRNLEDLMTDALTQLKRELTAKAAGLEFIPVHELKTRLQISSSANSPEEDDDDERDGEDGESSDECLQSESESDDGSSDEDKKYSLSTDKRGTEITLKHLQLKQNACALMLSKLSLMVQCGRCKTVATMALDQTTVMVVECGKCGHELMAKYRPSLAHALSSIVGYLDLENCVAFDLVLQDCTLVVSCLACSKSTAIEGLMTGQVTDSWCKACNAKFKLATEAVKFYLLEPSTVVTEGSKVEKIRSKSKRSVKDPAIREGFPLPDEGTCRHYKQSYRWLRFPCCGKAYPCDVCHDKKEDHLMDMATRMICGHCSREQNFSGSRPCVSCSGHLTKIKSSHWEGGSGCRDKIAMSRGDQQKFKNMNKTQSNHSKKVKAVGKKSTKLRHS